MDSIKRRNDTVFHLLKGLKGEKRRTYKNYPFDMSGEEWIEITQKAKEVRKSHSITQTKLANIFKYPQSDLSVFENSKSKNIDILFLYMNVFPEYLEYVYRKDNNIISGYYARSTYIKERINSIYGKGEENGEES